MSYQSGNSANHGFVFGLKQQQILKTLLMLPTLQGGRLC